MIETNDAIELLLTYEELQQENTMLNDKVSDLENKVDYLTRMVFESTRISDRDRELLLNQSSLQKKQILAVATGTAVLGGVAFFTTCIGIQKLAMFVGVVVVGAFKFLTGSKN